MKNEPLLQLASLRRYGLNSLEYTPTDTFDDATKLRGDDLVINIVKDDDNLVHQMWAQTWKMSLYSNSSDLGNTVTILRGII